MFLLTGYYIIFILIKVLKIYMHMYLYDKLILIKYHF